VRAADGFAFLGREAGMPIATLARSTAPKYYLRAFIVGVVNTLRVAAIGIVLATVVGTMIGIALCRPLAAIPACRVYVEVPSRHSTAAAAIICTC